MPKITINITKHQMQALWDTYQRAEDDWKDYVNAGGGPADFPRGEWGPHRKETEDALNRAFRAMQKIHAALETKRNAAKPKGKNQ